MTERSPEDELFTRLEQETFATTVATNKATGWSAVYKPRHIIAAILLLLAGLVVMVTAVATTTIWLGLLGFGVCFSGGYLASRTVSVNKTR